MLLYQTHEKKELKNNKDLLFNNLKVEEYKIESLKEYQIVVEVEERDAQK